MADSTSMWVSVALVIIAQFLCGAILYQFNVHQKFYQWIQWDPRSLYDFEKSFYFGFLVPILDMFICGSLITGVVGLASYFFNAYGR